MTTSSSISPVTQRVLDDAMSIAAAQCEASTEGAILWRELGTRHFDLLKKHGFENFKRGVNFEYGQSSISTPHHPFLLNLLKAVVRSGRFPSGLFAHPDFAHIEHIDWPVVKSTAASAHPGQNIRRIICYASFCGLLWQMAKTIDKLNALAVPEPAVGNPMPVRWKGQLISQDLAISAIDLNRIAEFVPLSNVRRILEIGGGYGRFAYMVHSLFPHIEYHIADISPTLAVSQNYLAAVFGEGSVARFSLQHGAPKSLNFHLPDQLAQFPDGYFDLVINMSSFDEMPSDTSTSYLKEINRICGGYVYLDGFPITSPLGNKRLGLDELPYDPRWKLVFSGRHRTHINFVEKIFDLRT